MPQALQAIRAGYAEHTGIHEYFTAEDIAAALIRVYNNVFPIHSTEDIVGLNEVQCGNPGLFAVASTNDAMAQYMRCLYTREQAEEAGIGSIYNPAW